MTQVMGYSDIWSARPGDRVSFMVSCIGAESYAAEIVRLKQPEAGPLATPFAPEPVDCPANGVYEGREQTFPIGSFAIVPAHVRLANLPAATLAAYVMPTTPEKGRQALAGTWCEASQTGFGLEIDEAGGLCVRLGAGLGKVLTLSSGVKMRAWRWHLVAMSFDAATGRLQLWQEPQAARTFDPDLPVSRESTGVPAGIGSSGPLTFAAWANGPTTEPSAWGELAFTCHFNGRIDRPRLVGCALDRVGIATLMAASAPFGYRDDLVAAWDFALDITGDGVTDSGPNRLDGTIVNQPTRAVPGHNWTGLVQDWTQAIDEYGAIHFHDDDLVDACWSSDFSFTVSGDLRSGVYAAKLMAGEFVSWIPFFVSPPKGTARSKVAFLAATATYTVYLNNKGRFLSSATEMYHGRVTVMDEIDALLFHHPGMGLSTYDRHSDGTGVAYASRLRPAHNFRPTGRHWNFNLDLFIIDWLEHLGGDYDVITEEQLHEEGMSLLESYNVVLTGSHPEYDSVEMLDALQAWLRRGGRLMYMGGNGFYWRIAHHPERKGLIEVRRAEGGVRAWDARPGEYYHSFSGEYGGLWRRNSRAPQELVGVGFISQGFDKCSYYRRTDAAADPRAAWMFDGVEGELIGDFGILQGGAAGLEIDAADPDLGTPPHALVVAMSENHSNTYELVAEEVLIPHGATDGIINQAIHADITFFETPNGGAVWSTGSIAYAGSLAWNGFDNNLCRLTTNVLRRFADNEPFLLPLADC